MKCYKCGHQNISENNVCDNCKTPIDKIECKKDDYPKKGKHIDIEDITEEKKQRSFNQTMKSVRIFLLFLFVIVIIGILTLVMMLFKSEFSQETMEKYEEMMEHSSLALIYLGDNLELDNVSVSYSENYDFDYLNINVHKISSFQKKKLKKELNISKLNSTFVIVQQGVPIANKIAVESNDELLEFLRENKLVPEIMGETSESLEIFENLIITSEEALIYLPTKYDEKTDKKSETIKYIVETNGIEYGEVKGYLLSQKQLKNIMSRIGFSEIQNDLIVFIREGKIVDVIGDDEVKDNDYFHLFLNRGIIDTETGDYLIKLNKTKFLKIINQKDIHVIFIGSDKCLYCDRTKITLSKIANQNNIDIYYLDSTKEKENISEIIKEIGYKDGLTSTPFVVIVENGVYVDSIIGLADKEIYINKFIEYGFIK